MQLGLQFIPGSVLVHLGHKSHVSFDYDVYDGQWHNFALDFRGRQVALHTSCGKKSLYVDLSSKNEAALNPSGSFLLGKMNHDSVPFEGAICQFDIYPSAQAAHNYCDYIKKHCREADTYRPVLPPMLPVFSDPNITSTSINSPPLTERPKRAQLTTLTRTTNLLPTESSTLNETSERQTVSSGAVLVSALVPTGSESPFRLLTQTVTAPLWISTSTPDPKVEPRARKYTKQRNSSKASGKRILSPASTKPSEMNTNFWTKAAPTQGSPSDTDSPHKKEVTTAAVWTHEPKVTNGQDFKPTTAVTPASTDGLQTLDLEPTQFSLLARAPGLKGEPGPPVSESSFH